MPKTTPASKPRLGRGLSSLIGPTVNFSATDQEYQHVTGMPPIAAPVAVSGDNAAGSPRPIAISDISPNPYQPRCQFDPADLESLSQSITQQGVLQPLIVVPSDTSDSATPYVLVAGERRLRAAKLAGLSEVPCVVRHATGQQMLEWALVENIQRSDLNPLERAGAYRQYMDRFALTHDEVAVRLGQPRSTVTNYLRILDLQPDVQQMVSDGKLSFGHAKVLAALIGQPERQSVLAGRVAAEDLSVRHLEGLVAAGQLGSQGPVKANAPRSKPPYVRDLEEQLTRAVGTKVSILPGRAKHAGRIVVDYYSLEDFDRITGALGLELQS